MKKSMVFVIVVCIVLSVAGCQSAAEKSAGPSLQPTEEVSPSPAPAGETVETDKFSVLVPLGWEVMDIDGGVQIYKMSGEVFAVAYRGYNMNDTEAQSQVESMAQQYQGTEPKQVELLGKQFWTTTFVAASVPQVMYLRMEDGVMLSVKYGGPNIDTNPDFQTILNSIVFK